MIVVVFVVYVVCIVVYVAYIVVAVVVRRFLSRAFSLNSFSQVHVQQIRDMVIQERIDAWKAEMTGRQEKEEMAKTTTTAAVHECRVDELIMLTEEGEAEEVDRVAPEEEAVEEETEISDRPNREEVDELKSEMKKKDEEIEKLKTEIAKLKIESVQND